MTIAARTQSRHTIRPASPAPESRRILAIDYGRKRIGLALSDELGITARPLATLERTNRRNDLRRLREICRTNAVVRVLVGYPLHLNGDAGEMAAESARFASRLRKDLGLVVELVDERLTTWEAEQTLIRSISPSRPRRRPVDHVAAAILLRDYLAHNPPSLRPPGAEQA